jgi:hypothetical protein
MITAMMFFLGLSMAGLLAVAVLATFAVLFELQEIDRIGDDRFVQQ